MTTTLPYIPFWRRGAALLSGNGFSLRGHSMVQFAVDFLITQNGLHIFACFCEGNGFDKFIHSAIAAHALPVGHAIFPGVVGSKGVFRLVMELVQHLP